MIKKPNNLEKRRGLARAVLPEIKKLVAKYDLPAVQNAVKQLYEERKAARELKIAEEKVRALKKKINN